MHTQSLPPSDRDEATAKPAAAPKKLYPCDATLRLELLAKVDVDGWTKVKIAAKCGVSTSIVSQYLYRDADTGEDVGCTYPGDVPKFERSAREMLSLEARRRAYGVETTLSQASAEMESIFTYARETNDMAVILGESGDGKTRGIELYRPKHALSELFDARTWHRHEGAVKRFLFETAPQGDYDHQTPWMDYAVLKHRGTDRFFIIDNAHRLTLRSLQLCADFHDDTHCPFGLVGTYELLEILQKDPQLYSRLGLRWEIGRDKPRKLIEHLVKSFVPNANGDFDELCDLCKQVVDHGGHFRAAQKRLKLAVELKNTTDALKKATWPECFRAAHTKMVQNYKLS